VPIGALPAVVLGLECDLFAAASRANHAIAPAAGQNVLPCLFWIGCHHRNLLKGLVFEFRTQIIPYYPGIAKYIFT